MPRDLLSEPRDLLDRPPVVFNPNLSAQAAKAEASREARGVSEFVSQRDPGIDYSTGVKNAPFRSYLSLMTNEAEKTKFLDNTIGKGLWDKDSFGALYLKPEGLKKLGIKSDKPISIDEQISTRYDVADVAGDAPAVIGATGYGVAASGLGLIPGMGMAALGAGLGKAATEITKNLMGDQVATPGEVAADIGEEAAYGAVGEGVGRGVGAVTKHLLGPGAARMTPEKKALADSAIEQGFKIRPGSVTDAPLLARWEGMVRQIFGDRLAGANTRAATQGLERLAASSGPRVSREAAGEAVKQSIVKQRVAFSENFAQRYGEIDQLVGGVPIVPTNPIVARAQDILEKMPKTADGKVIGGKDAFIRDILQMGDRMTVTQAQRLRTMLREASERPDLLPDVSKHDARELKKAVDEAFEAAKTAEQTGISEQAINKLRSADMAYRKGIEQFDRPIIKRIARDASKNGAVEADEVVDYLVKPGRVVRLRQVKGVVNAGEWAKVKSSHAQDLLANVVKGTDDPLVSVFDGRGFRDTLDKYGREVLEEVHGKEWTDSAYKFANALMLSEKRMSMSGGIVAANIALHPLRNLPKLLWIGSLARVMEQPGTFKYLTEGFKHGPNTDAAAGAVNRLLNQAMALARDETGSARITLTSPDAPQNEEK